MHTNHDGNNNPNIPGQDNGLNAWMDVKLNGDQIDNELRFNAGYAKRNSDKSSFYDIDHIPLRGPPRIKSIPENITLEQAAQTATMLMNEDNLSICRTTGMMRPKHENREAPRQVSSTVSRTDNRKETGEERGHHTHTYRNKGPGNYRSAMQDTWHQRYHEEWEWDTDDQDEFTDNEQNITHDLRSQNPKNTDFRNSRQCDMYARDDGRQQYRHTRGPYQDRGNRDDMVQYIRSREHNAAENHRKTSRGKKAYYEEFSSDSDTSQTCNKDVRSGISARPNSRVKLQQVYPHFSLGQVSGFIGQNLQFHNFTFKEFIAREMVTITSTSDPQEAEGRMQLLQRISL